MTGFMLPTPPDAKVFGADGQHAWLALPNHEVARLSLSDGTMVRRMLPGVERRWAAPYLVAATSLVPADLSSDGRELPIEHDERVIALTATESIIASASRRSVRAIDNASFAALWEVPEGQYSPAPARLPPQLNHLTSQLVVGDTIYGTMLWNGYYELAVFPASAQGSVRLEPRGTPDLARVMHVDPQAPMIVVVHHHARVQLTAPPFWPKPKLNDYVLVNGTSWLLPAARTATEFPISAPPPPPFTAAR